MDRGSSTKSPGKFSNKATGGKGRSNGRKSTQRPDGSDLDIFYSVES